MELGKMRKGGKKYQCHFEFHAKMSLSHNFDLTECDSTLGDYTQKTLVTCVICTMTVFIFLFCYKLFNVK